MPGIFGHNAGVDLVVGVSTADEILYEKLLALRMLDEIGVEKLEGFRRDRLVVVPLDLIFGIGVADYEFVLRRTARVLAGAGNERALCRQFGFATADGFLIEPSRSEVIKDCGEFLQSRSGNGSGRIVNAGLSHGVSAILV